MPYLDDVLNPYQSLTGDLTPEDTLTGLLSEDGLLQGALAISDVVGVTELTELTDVSITNPINNDVLTYNDVTEKWENMPAQGGGGGTSDYEDLDNKPSINSVTLTGNQTTDTLGLFSGDYDDLTNKPELATVATTGDYDDLIDKPTIPAAQVNSDWDAESGVEQILNKPELATVATSGSYNDLTDTPTVATTCSISRGPTMPGTFPVPNICRRGNTVVIRFSVLLPAGSYTTSQVLWNYTPLMVDLPALVFPVYGSGEVNLIKINTDGTIIINANKTFGADTWLIGEATFLTDG